MLKLMEIQSHACSYLVHHGFAASWSENNQIAMMTEKGVQILELRFNPHNKTSAIDCDRSSLETSDLTPTNHIGINAVNIFHESEASEASALILNPDWAPALDKTCPMKKVLVQTVWSPRGVLHYGRCLLACLTNMGQLTLYGADRSQWVEKIDISRIWLRYCRKKWSRPSTNIKHQITELQYRASRIKYTAVAWERFHGDEYSCSTLLITASQDGIIGLWIVEDEKYKSNLNLEPITMTLTDGIKVKLMRVFDSKLTNITSFLWCCIDSRSGVLIAGNVKGAINSVRINFCDASKKNTQPDEMLPENMDCNVPDKTSLQSAGDQNKVSEASKSESVDLVMHQSSLEANVGGFVGDNEHNLTSEVQPNLKSDQNMELGPSQTPYPQIIQTTSELVSNTNPTTDSYPPIEDESNSTTGLQASDTQLNQSSAFQPNLNFESQTLHTDVLQSNPIPETQPILSIEARPKLTTETQPIPTSEVQHKMTFEAQPNQTSETQPNLTSEVQPKITSESQPNLTSEAQPNLITETQPKQTTEVQPNLTFEVQPNLTLVVQPNLTSETQPYLTTETQPYLTTETQPKLTTETQPNLTSEVQPKITSETQPNLTPEAQPNFIIETKISPTTETQSNAITETQPNITEVQPNLTLDPQPKPVSEPNLPSPGNVEINVEPLWPEEDLLSVSNLICWDADNNNVCAVCIKGTHIIVLILRKDNGKLVSKHCHNTRRCNLTGLIKLNNAAFLIGSQRGAIFKLTLVQDDDGEVTFLNETVQTNFIKNRYGVMGLAASRNRAFIAVNVSLNGPYDNSKLKTLSSFVMSSFENTEIDPLAVVNSKNFVNLDTVWDCLENARLNILQKSIIYIVPPTIREQLDTMDINPLIITMWLTNFVAYSLQLEQMESGIEFSIENKSQSMTKLFNEIRLLVFTSQIFQRCTNLLFAHQLTSFELSSVCLMRQWLTSLATLDDIHATTKLTAASILEQIEAKQLPLLHKEACVVCDGDVVALTDFSVSTCVKGHQTPRCSISLVQIPSDCTYLYCPRCGVLAHPLAVSGDFALCVFCNDQLTLDKNLLTQDDILKLKVERKEDDKKENKGKRGKESDDLYTDSEEEDRIVRKRKKKSKKF